MQDQEEDDYGYAYDLALEKAELLENIASVESFLASYGVQVNVKF